VSDVTDGLAALSAPPTGGTKGGATSDLTIDETLLLHAVGWEPADVVFGVSWFSIPWGAWQWQVGEVTDADNAFAQAVAAASNQMRDECARAGASGVVGVEIEFAVHSHHVDVALTGTAVRRTVHPTVGFEFLSDLSARDFALLTRAGWAPLSLVAGASFVIAPRRTAGTWVAQKGQNMEMTNLTEALYLARERAMERMQEAGIAAQADGVVGVRLREGPLAHNARIMQFVAIGTAVRLIGDAHQPMSPTMVVALDDPVVQFAAASLRSPG
jgi:uncharacterized protein YbjQ (UPF0145 family)